MIEFKIILNDKGQVSVSGPIKDKVLSLGLLELAKNIVINYKESPIISEAKDIIKGC